MEKENLDFSLDQKVQYCIPIALRDEQVKLSIKRISDRVQPILEPLIDQKIAVVCYGPSLKKTWKQIKKFKTIITCSGAHKFLVDRGIIPTYHIDVDPRPHKVTLMGEPQQDTTYLIASCCHPKLFDHLEGNKVKLWHVFTNDDESQRVLPKGEWAVTGGSSAGLRAMTMARFLGYTDLHVFGMDGNIEDTSHAGDHPNSIKEYREVEFNGKKFKTIPSLLHCAKETQHELNQMPDVKATFYGKGLTQEIMKNWVPSYKNNGVLGYTSPSIISKEYIELNKKLHESTPTYGMGGAKYADTTLKLAKTLINDNNQFVSILDFGAGKGTLGTELAKSNIIIAEYDPAIPGKDETPRPADLVICTDVLEHIEPDKLEFLLDELKRVTRKLGYYVISTRKAGKILADGRNAHLIVEGKDWWESKLKKYFTVNKVIETKHSELHVVVTPKKK